MLRRRCTIALFFASQYFIVTEGFLRGRGKTFSQRVLPYLWTFEYPTKGTSLWRAPVPLSSLCLPIKEIVIVLKNKKLEPTILVRPLGFYQGSNISSLCFSSIFLLFRFKKKVTSSFSSFRNLYFIIHHFLVFL